MDKETVKKIKKLANEIRVEAKTQELYKMAECEKIIAIAKSLAEMDKLIRG